MSALASELRSRGFVLPDYKNSNVEAMRQFSRGNGEFVGDREKKIFLLLDGFGYNLLEKVMYHGNEMGNMFAQAEIRKAVTVFPSFTISAISSIDSGLTVAEHGIAGEEIPLKEAGSIISMLLYSPAISSAVKLDESYGNYIYPKPYLIDEIRKRHRFAYVQDEYIIGKEYSRKMFDGADMVSYVSFEDMLLQASRLLKGGKHDRIYAYHPLIDHAEHVYGPYSEEVANVVSSAVLSIKRLLLPLLKANDCNLIITADHGQKTFTKKSFIRFGADDKLMSYLTMPSWGMSRTPFFDVFPGREKHIEDYFGRKYGRKGMLVESDEAIKAGLFGRKYVDERHRPRFGTHVVISGGDSLFKYTYPGKEPKQRRDVFGHHGGLSKEEMEIPVVTF